MNVTAISKRRALRRRLLPVSGRMVVTDNFSSYLMRQRRNARPYWPEEILLRVVSSLVGGREGVRVHEATTTVAGMLPANAVAFLCLSLPATNASSPLSAKQRDGKSA